MQHPTAETNFNAGVRLYFEPKPATDRDLVKEVRDILLTAGVSEEGLQRNYDAHRHISEAKTKVSVVQQNMVNRYIDVTLKRSPKNSMQIRAELLASGDINNWAKQVETRVAPFVVETKLLEK